MAAPRARCAPKASRRGGPSRGTWSSWPWSRACTGVTSTRRAPMRPAATNRTGYERTNLWASPRGIFVTTRARKRLVGDRPQDRYCGSRLRGPELCSQLWSRAGSARERAAPLSLLRPCPRPAVASRTLGSPIRFLDIDNNSTRLHQRTNRDPCPEDVDDLCRHRSFFLSFRIHFLRPAFGPTVAWYGCTGPEAVGTPTDHSSPPTCQPQGPLVSGGCWATSWSSPSYWLGVTN
jgi:hypothetical protein